MKNHGELTAWVARKVSEDWGKRGYDVLYDHGLKSEDENVGNIVSWFGDIYNREAELSQLDIAIVKKNSDNVFALIEIEETNDRPKNFLGDVWGVLMGDHIKFGGKRDLSVDELTVLIVIGKSENDHSSRNWYIQDRVREIKSLLPNGYLRIGPIVIDTFSEKKGLDTVLSSVLERAFRGEL